MIDSKFASWKSILFNSYYCTSDKGYHTANHKFRLTLMSLQQLLIIVGATQGGWPIDASLLCIPVSFKGKKHVSS